MHHLPPHYPPHLPTFHSQTNLSLPLTPTFALKPLTLKKSIFNPQSHLEQAYIQRNKLTGVNTPQVQIIHSSRRWLLLQTNFHSNNFFKKLSRGRLGNIPQQILSLFTQFVGLAYYYGYFRINKKMIFVLDGNVMVWMSDDVFDLHPKMPLEDSMKGEKMFIQSFMVMLQDNIRDWNRINNIASIQQMFRMLQSLIKLQKGSMTLLNASKQVFTCQKQSLASFASNQLRFFNDRFSQNRSLANLHERSRLSHFQPQLSNSFTVKELERKNANNQGLFHRVYKQEQKQSIQRQQMTSLEIHNVKRKFNLMSTSSTLQKFSQRLRTTRGKVQEGQISTQEIQGKQQSKSALVQIEKSSKSGNIVDELQGLFQSQRGPQSIQKSQLEKIAQQMEEVLLW